MLLGDFMTGDVIAEIASDKGSSRDNFESWAQIEGRIDQSTLEGIGGEILPWRHYLAWVNDGWIISAGPVASWKWSPEQSRITAVGAEAYLRKREVLPPAAAGVELMLESTVTRNKRSTKTRREWRPNPEAATVVNGRTARAAATVLLTQLRFWPNTPPIVTTHYTQFESGAESYRWEGIEHRKVYDAMTEVLAGVEWRLDPYWVTDSQMAWDLLVGDPMLIRDDAEIGWPAGLLDLSEIEFDGSDMANRSSATARDGDGAAINRTRSVNQAPLLVESYSVGTESATGSEVAAKAAAGVITAASPRVKLSMPTARVGYLLLGHPVTLELPDHAPVAPTGWRVVDVKSDLESGRSELVLAQGVSRGR